MTSGWFGSIFKTIVSITLILLIASLAIVGIERLNPSFGAAVASNADDILDEMLGNLPGIGFVIQSGIAAFDAQRAIEPVELSVYSEVLYAFVLFCAYSVMEKINALVDRVFSSMPSDGGWMGWLCGYSIKLAEIISAVVIANLGISILSSTGFYGNTAVLLGVIALAAVIMLLIGKKRGVLSVVIDSVAEVVIGMIVVCLIYIVVLCLKMMRVMDTASPMEWTITTSGFIVAVLALVLIESNAFAKGLSAFLSSHFDR